MKQVYVRLQMCNSVKNQTEGRKGHGRRDSSQLREKEGWRGEKWGVSCEE